ncbi:hypothetical protein N7520_003562 [Penicillium odoratum]|uniref:uncharacterized protein n=1 Tax=Penicillium odoratum TaxID=1167516 RepID=UPI002548F0D4|nr:uncharacterized protein N7520_003562 [Penicillium odoratum]KAJ5769003.1 hypothetical protein N7520_003562 [Penicillium odoratum]
MSLKHYSQIALKESRLTSEAELNSVRLLEGDLKPESENLILAYAGSFNPPHRGHIDVLLSALRREIGAIAIVIVPSEDFFLRNKIRDKYPEFFLSQKRRVDILNAIPSIPKDRVWVWPSTWYPFKSYTKAMARVTEADGLNVRFSWLIGPDLLNPQDATFVVPYSLQGVLVSNKARHVKSHFLPNGTPTVWKGFGKWDCKTSVETNGELSDHAQCDF